jgi:hypothetical protein
MLNQFKVDIGEPWDFRKPDGTNWFVVEGMGISRVNEFPDLRPGYLVRVIDPFVFEGQTIGYLLLHSRYKGHTVTDIMGKGCTVIMFVVNPGPFDNLGEISISRKEMISINFIGYIRPIDSV